MVTLLVDYFLSFFLRLTQLYTLCVWYVYIVPTTYCIEEVVAYIGTFIFPLQCNGYTSSRMSLLVTPRYRVGSIIWLQKL